MSPASELTKLVRAAVEKACVAFTARVKDLGFQRSRKMFWVRVHGETADVVHLHRGGSSYGAPMNASVDFRLHLAIRVLNDTFPAIALNGPHSDAAPKEERYHLRFNAESMHMFERCVDDLTRFVSAVGEPWFLRFRSQEALLAGDGSPLDENEKTRLREALAGRALDGHRRATLKELGLAKK
jgi:hypothetical protein